MSYGGTTSKSMTECRVKMWFSKTEKTGDSSVKLYSLPPTSEAFIQNARRCHFQVAIWKSALLHTPPKLDPTRHGWKLNHQGVLIPRTVPSDTPSAPSDVLQLIHCNCKTSGCRTEACKCYGLGCTSFCLCDGGEVCKYPLTRCHRTR